MSELSFEEDQEQYLAVSARRAARVPAEFGGDLYRDCGRMVRRAAPFNGKPCLDENYPRVRNVFGTPQAAAGAVATEPERLYEVGLATSRSPSPASVREFQQQVLAAFQLLE